MLRELGKISGVICEICGDGVQCRRSVAAEGTITCTEPLEDRHTHKWTTTCCYSGGFSVKCMDCPE